MSAARNESGMALMLALLFVVLLTAIVIEFCYEAQVDASLAENQIAENQAYWAAKSAISRGLSLLANDIDQAYEGSTGTGAGTSQTTGQSGGAATPRRPDKSPSPGGGAPGDGAMYDSLQDVWAEGIPYEGINEAIMQCLIDDEYGKINLNALVTSARPESAEGGLEGGSSSDVEVEQEVNEFVVEALRALFQARGLEGESVDAIVDSIIDWIDQDDDESNEGAEYDYYESLELPFGCKNGRMTSVEELLMIRGMTPELFWGKPEEEQLPLTELLTVHGHPQGRVNINTAEWETLDAVGIVMGSGALADTVIPEREDNPFMDESDIQSRLGLESGQERTSNSADVQQDTGQDGTADGGTPGTPDPFAQPFVAESSVFRIRGHGMAGKSTVRIEAYVWRNSGMTGDMTEPFRIIDWRLIR